MTGATETVARRALPGLAELALTSAAVALLHFLLGLGLTIFLAWSFSDLPSGRVVLVIVDAMILTLALCGSLLHLLDPEPEPSPPRHSLAALLGAYVGEGFIGQARALWVAILARIPLALGHLVVDAIAPLWVALDPRTHRLLAAYARLQGVVPTRLVAELVGVRSPAAMSVALNVARRVGGVRVFEGTGARRVGPGPEHAALAEALGVVRGDQR